MKTPRVLIFSVAYEPLIGGAELAVRNITDRLPSLDFDLVTCRFQQSDLPVERVGNVAVYRVGWRFVASSRLGRYLYPVLAFFLAKKLHRRKPYQVVWSIMAAYAGAAALMFKRHDPEVKLLLTLQEGDSIEHIHEQVRGFHRIWQSVFRRADHIQAISTFLADWAREEGATCPVEVVPNGVDIDKFKNQNSKIKIADKNSKFVIITTSRLVHKNGLDTLIRAAAELKILIKSELFVVQILGTGPEERKLKKMASDLGVTNLVRFLGDVRPDDVPGYLSKADIFVRASRSEGLGISFLEAMAAGLPIVATRVGGIPDFLEDGQTGLFALPDDPKDLARQIHRLMDNQELGESLSVSARRLVEERYNWDRIAEQIGAIFRKLIL